MSAPGRYSRAYLREDPQLFQRKVVDEGYPIGAYAAFEAVLKLAEQQPQRGRFASAQLVSLLLERPREGMRTGLGRWVAYLVDHRDLVRQPDGSLYVDGWDEWQEGDVTVVERMTRLRARRRSVTAAVTPPVTVEVTAQTVTVPSERKRKRIAVANQVSNSPKPGARAPRARGSATQENEPRLTAAQLRAWDPYTAKAWRPFQQAWLERGFKRPPTGGDDGQAQLLWQIADARSDDLGIWVAEAPRGATSQEVVGYVLERWHAIRREVAEAEVEQERQRRRTPPERAGDVLARLGLAASRREEGSA